MKQDIRNLRLAAQHIQQADFSHPEDVVHHMLAMQAQDYTGALWSIGLRTKHGTQAAVTQAILDRKIVRTWPMRGTLHFMHAADVRWMTQLLAPRITASAKNRRMSLGLSDVITQEAEDVVREVLAGGKILSRPELLSLLQQRVKSIQIGNQQASHLFRNFGERGVICFGPRKEKQPTFVLLDDWLPFEPVKDRQEALGTLAHRYFSGHGPATLQDFAGWGYLRMTDAKLAVDIAGTHLVAQKIDGQQYYICADMPQTTTVPTAYLLPGFDEYMLGYKDRSAALVPAYAQAVVPGNNGMFLPTVVINGQVVGTWKSKVRSTNIGIEIKPFKVSDTAYTEVLETALRRYSNFMNMSITLT